MDLSRTDHLSSKAGVGMMIDHVRSKFLTRTHDSPTGGACSLAKFIGVSSRCVTGSRQFESMHETCDLARPRRALP